MRRINLATAAFAVLGMLVVTSPARAAEPTREQAIEHLKGLLAALEAKDYDKAATFFAMPPKATPEQLKATLPKVLELKELSAEGIEAIAEQGKWGKLTEVAGERGGARWATRFGVKPDECYALVSTPGEAAFHWDGTKLRMIRCDDIGKLRKGAK